MRPGHPFLTAALDDQRSRQRRELAAVPTWLKRDLRRISVTPPAGGSPRLESALRDLIDELHPEWAEVLAQFCDAAVVDAQWELVGAVAEASLGHQDSLVSYFDEARGAPSVEDLGAYRTDGRHPVDLRRLIAFYILADALADDGYEDEPPRGCDPWDPGNRRNGLARGADATARDAGRPDWPMT